MKKINNSRELREEIFRLKLQKKQQEDALKRRVDQLTDKFRPVMKVLDFLGVVDTDGEQGGENSKNGLGKLALKKGLEYGLPFFLNRLLFRSRVKAGLSSLLGIALGEGAKNLVNREASKIADPIADFLKGLFDGKSKERQNERQARRTFEGRYDNLDRDIYS